MTRKAERRAKAGRGSGPPGKPGYRIVSHCPECPAYPREGHGMTGAQVGKRTMSCRHGHKWVALNGLRMGRRSVAQ